MSYPEFSFHTTADEVATAFADIIRGKNVLITGTSLNGIGFDTARVIAKYANLVIITGYNAERLKLTEEAIKKESPSANIRRLTLDLSSLAAVRSAAAEVNSWPEPLHVLINNAAAQITPFSLTVDKLESQMATGHIGPFLFTKLIAPKILAAGSSTYTPRVVFVSSIGHGFGNPGVDFANMKKPDALIFKPMQAYFETKASNVLAAKELSKRSKGKINAYSLHPGGIFTNIMQKGDGPAEMHRLGMLDEKFQPRPESNMKTIPQGAATTVVAAFDPRIQNAPGSYLNDCVAANELVSAFCTDPANAEKVWATTEEIIGEKFEF
ncbi:short-chain dehydrogenase/reductase family protein [Favolaschia claudopus]|uniref:Short-chain dehydrogenase/reductase family protein n=1 Tax=Favolaschia claudopus TaxID=2862362 RepID=A0AAW0C3K0_9AGAR